jgi:LmbE family N-acetylglucosaminyl deacetylase
MKKSIIAFGAHSDDVDLRVGATLLNYKKQGYDIHYVVVTTSASGIPKLSPNEAFPIRQHEAEEAAKLYGTKPIFLNFQKTVNEGASNQLPQGKPYVATALRNNLALDIIKDLIEKFEPEIVFTHNPNDLHEDHYHTAAIVYTAFGQAKSQGSRLLMWETGSKGRMIDFIPTTFIRVDANDVALKDKAIKMHASQYEVCPWFERFAQENAEYWGKKSALGLAEAFIEVPRLA